MILKITSLIFISLDINDINCSFINLLLIVSLILYLVVIIFSLPILYIIYYTYWLNCRSNLISCLKFQLIYFMDDYFISLRKTSPPIFLFLREQSSQVNPTRMKRVARKKGEGLRGWTPAIWPMRNLTYSFFYVIPPVSQSGTRNSFLLRPTKTPHSTLCIAAKIEFQILSLFSLLQFPFVFGFSLFRISDVAWKNYLSSSWNRTTNLSRSPIKISSFLE